MTTNRYMICFRDKNNDINPAEIIHPNEIITASTDEEAIDKFIERLYDIGGTKRNRALLKKEYGYRWYLFHDPYKLANPIRDILYDKSVRGQSSCEITRN